MNRNTTIVIAVLAAGIIAGAAVWAVRTVPPRTSTTNAATEVSRETGNESAMDKLTRAVHDFLFGGSATDKAMAVYRAQPLVGQVLTDNPSIAAELRGAIEEDQSRPEAGQSRVFATIAKLRQTVIAPTVAAADDATALAVMKARVALVSYLQKHDIVACRQFAAAGIQDITRLDDEGQQLFRATLTAMEAAYRNGKANGGKGSLPSAEEFRAMLQTAGFTDDDFAKLRDAATLKDADFCALELRIDEAPDKLPDDKRGPFAHFVIAH